MILFKYLKKYKFLIFIILILSICRIYAELELPNYTSSIVNVGINQKGIEDALMLKMSSKTYSTYSLFMNEEELKLFNKAYKEDSGYYKLESIDKASKKKLNITIEEVAYTIYTLMSSKQLESSILNNVRNKYYLYNYRKEAINKIKDNKELFLSKVAVRFVEEEYKNVGIDTNKISNEYLKNTAINMIFITFIILSISVTVSFIASRVAASIGKNLRKQIYEKVINFSTLDIEKFSISSLITRTTNDITQVQNSLSMILVIVLYAPLMAIAGSIKVLKTNVNMSYMIALGISLIIVLIVISFIYAMPKFKAMQTLLDRINLVSREILTGIQVIRVFGRERYEEKRFDKENQKHMKNEKAIIKVIALFFPYLMLVLNALSILILYVGSKQVDLGYLQVGDLLAFLTYSMMIIFSFIFLTMSIVIIPRASVAAKRIDEVLTTDFSIKEKEKTLDEKLENVKGIVKFNNVTFSFPDSDDEVLEDVSFTLEPSKTTAIIGATGSGKSTILHLLLRYFDVNKGNITIDGIDIRDLSLRKLRSLIGFVPQKAVLFSGNIESNIKYLDESLEDNTMKKAAQIAEAEEFILSKDKKYKTPISEYGSNVSGGQKQRLSIARALVGSPNILLFDDSFSALDYKTDFKVRENIHKNLTNKTVVIVAQRIATILHADKIIVLDKGEVVGVGTHEELLKKNKIYKEIAESQLSKEELTTGGKNEK
jgi:ABC transporter, ATP-binding/permease protein